jgi:ABC-type antimicrobial peptide transport system permease subunit
VLVVTDVRRALRSLAHSPGLTATLVLTIAIGAGSTATLFGFIGGLTAHGVPDAGPAEALRFLTVARLLAFACGSILLIACATVAGLLLSRSSARMLETAVKVALGATRRRLARQSALESLIVSLTGGAAGVLCAWWTSRAFPLLFFAGDAETLAMTPDVAWVAGAGLVWVFVMAVCGMTPVLTVPHRDPSIVLRRDASAVSNRARRFRTWLVVAQIALCALIVTVAAAIGENLHRALRTSRGNVIGSLLVAQVQSDAGPTNAIEVMQYLRALEAKARALPGVTGVVAIRTLPGGFAAEQTFAVERANPEWREVRLDVATFSSGGLSAEQLRPLAGRLFGGRDGPGTCRVAVVNAAAATRYFDGDAVGRSLEQSDGTPVQIIGVLSSTQSTVTSARPALFYYEFQRAADEGVIRDELFRASRTVSRPQVSMNVNVTSPEYFEVFADPPIAGRALGAGDREGACRVAVVSEQAARTVFEGRAVGSALVDPDGDRIEIVGVVRAEALGVAQRSQAPMLFLPLSQAYLPRMALAIRAHDTSPAFLANVDTGLGSVAGGTLVSKVSTLDAHLERTALAPERIATTLVGACAALAIVLSIAGVYAVMADLVVRRRRELALRIALGAGPGRLVGGVIREGLRLAAVGCAIGIVAAAAAAPLLGRIVVRPQLPGPFVILAACFAVAVLVGLACAVPAWRAVSVDPRTVMQD